MVYLLAHRAGKVTQPVVKEQVGVGGCVSGERFGGPNALAESFVLFLFDSAFAVHGGILARDMEIVPGMSFSSSICALESAMGLGSRLARPD